MNISVQDSLYTCVRALGLPGVASGKEPTRQCKRHETWVWSPGGEDTKKYLLNTTLYDLHISMPHTGD